MEESTLYFITSLSLNISTYVHFVSGENVFANKNVFCFLTILPYPCKTKKYSAQVTQKIFEEDQV